MGVANRGTEGVASDPSETVDTYLQCNRGRIQESGAGGDVPHPRARATMLAQFQSVLESHFEAHSTAPRPARLDHWWPGRTRFEVIASAILVQNTAWTNAQRALAELRRTGKLSLAGVRGTGEAELGALVRSSGCWRQKARCLKTFVDWLDQCHGGSLARLFAQPTHVARGQLLALHGIGEETADAILLFAGGHPVLVWDAYTRRILAR